MAYKFDYNQTVNQAKELENLAADLQNRTVKRLDEVYNNVNAAWTGDSAKVYLKYLMNIKEDMQKKSAYLKQTADFLRETAKKMQQADAQAKASVSKI